MTSGYSTRHANVKYILWDASAVIAYYVPELAATAKAAERVENLVQSLRHHRFNGFFYIPNVVVAETFVTFDRYHYSTWDRKVNKKFGAPGRSLHAVRYRSARSRFRRDIHNGALFYQCDLNRYHILGLDLISPVDKHRKFYRKPSVSSMGTFDLLIGAMALHFTKIHGPDNFALLTTDRRMQAIFDQTCRTLPASTRRRAAVLCVTMLSLVRQASDTPCSTWRNDGRPQRGSGGK